MTLILDRAGDLRPCAIPKKPWIVSKDTRLRWDVSGKLPAKPTLSGDR
ncbi:hypothetical protein [Microcoleus sp. PH2017_28_MFU_U_A]|nr:hypothetical protein [Microcoleus sp. PH2017_28_MFU_U_A]MCC3592024.1 hypothetical protein [Microcoleus sp. PH2017_28_MFU_U_A]